MATFCSTVSDLGKCLPHHRIADSTMSRSQTAFVNLGD